MERALPISHPAPVDELVFLHFWERARSAGETVAASADLR